MTAETVYTVCKALSNSERVTLYNMLKQDFDIELPKSGKPRKLEFSDADALKFIYDKLF
jgi:hypothetical protein